MKNKLVCSLVIFFVAAIIIVSNANAASTWYGENNNRFSATYDPVTQQVLLKASNMGYTYKLGYYATQDEWISYNFEQETSGLWIVTKTTPATKTLNSATNPITLGNENYFLAWGCTMIPGGWDCNNNKWLLDKLLFPDLTITNLEFTGCVPDTCEGAYEQSSIAPDASQITFKLTVKNVGAQSAITAVTAPNTPDFEYTIKLEYAAPGSSTYVFLGYDTFQEAGGITPDAEKEKKITITDADVINNILHHPGVYKIRATIIPAEQSNTALDEEYYKEINPLNNEIIKELTVEPPPPPDVELKSIKWKVFGSTTEFGNAPVPQSSNLQFQVTVRNAGTQALDLNMINWLRFDVCIVDTGCSPFIGGNIKEIVLQPNEEATVEGTNAGNTLAAVSGQHTIRATVSKNNEDSHLLDNELNTENNKIESEFIVNALPDIAVTDVKWGANYDNPQVSIYDITIPFKVELTNIGDAAIQANNVNVWLLSQGGPTDMYSDSIGETIIPTLSLEPNQKTEVTIQGTNLWMANVLGGGTVNALGFISQPGTYTIKAIIGYEGTAVDGEINTENNQKPAQITIANTPVLSWTGETGYVSGGVNPNLGVVGSTFVYRVKYMDSDGNEPQTNSVKLHVKKAGTEISGSPFVMVKASGAPTTGEIYTKGLTISEMETNYKYYFEAVGSNGIAATGTPTSPQAGPIVTYICKDSDGENNPSVYGTCRDASGQHLDNCQTYSSMLKEFYCDATNTCVFAIVNCPAGQSCLNGKCAPIVYTNTVSSLQCSAAGSYWLASNYNPQLSMCHAFQLSENANGFKILFTGSSGKVNMFVSRLLSQFGATVGSAGKTVTVSFSYRAVFQRGNQISPLNIGLSTKPAMEQPAGHVALALVADGQWHDYTARIGPTTISANRLEFYDSVLGSGSTNNYFEIKVNSVTVS